MHPLAPNVCYVRLQRLCLDLGWVAPLIMHRTPNEFHDRLKPSLTRYFFSMHEMNSPIYVQINPQTDQHPRLFAMNIYAIRYRLCTGWQGFMLDRNQGQEVLIQWPWLHSSNFETLRSRRVFRTTNPECNGYSWRRVRDSGPPYTQSTTYARWQIRRIANHPMNRSGGSAAS
jgi:hypothetical protein